jgi:prepilin-type processing-associated H-X9-DG protein
MYFGDNNDYLPLNFVDNPAQNWIQGHAQTDWNTTNIQNGVLYPFNKSVGIYACPANTVMVTKPASGPGTTASQVPQTRTCSISYALGGNGNSSANGPWTISRLITFGSFSKASQLLTAPQTFVFGEEAQTSLDDGEFAMYPLVNGAVAANTWWNLASTRHNNGSTFSFADGHAEYWKWHGATLAGNQNNASPNAIGLNGDIAGDTSDDLPRAEGVVPYRAP